MSAVVPLIVTGCFAPTARPGVGSAPQTTGGCWSPASCPGRGRAAAFTCASTSRVVAAGAVTSGVVGAATVVGAVAAPARPELQSASTPPGASTPAAAAVSATAASCVLGDAARCSAVYRVAATNSPRDEATDCKVVSRSEAVTLSLDAVRELAAKAAQVRHLALDSAAGCGNSVQPQAGGNRGLCVAEALVARFLTT